MDDNKKKKNRKNYLSGLTRLPQTVVTFAKEARDELKKVSWPSRPTTIRYTVIVIVASLAVGFIIGGIDYLFSLSLSRVI